MQKSERRSVAKEGGMAWSETEQKDKRGREGEREGERNKQE